MPAAEARRWLEDLDVPVRVVAGDGDGAMDLTFLDAVARSHQRLSLRVVAGGGHYLPLARANLCVES